MTYTHPYFPGKRFPAPFTLDGVQYARGWFDKTTPQKIASLGFVEYVPPEPEPPTVEERKAFLKDQVKLHGDSILRGGFPHDFGEPYGVQHLQLRNEEDRTNWLTSQAAFKAQIEAGNGAVEQAKFRTAENDTIVMSFLDAYTLLLGMAAWGAALFEVSWAKQDAIDAAADHAALDVLEADIDNGWTI